MYAHGLRGIHSEGKVDVLGELEQALYDDTASIGKQKLSPTVIYC